MERFALQELTQVNGGFELIFQLDAHGVLARNRGKDVDGLALRGHSEVVSQVGDAVELEAFGGIELVARDGGATRNVTSLYINAEGGQRFNDVLLSAVHFLTCCSRVFFCWRTVVQ